MEGRWNQVWAVWQMLQAVKSKLWCISVWPRIVVRKKNCYMPRRTYRVLSIFAKFQRSAQGYGNASRQELRMYCSINVPENTEHDFSTRRCSTQLLWCQLTFVAVFRYCLLIEMMHPALVRSINPSPSPSHRNNNCRQVTVRLSR